MQITPNRIGINSLDAISLPFLQLLFGICIWSKNAILKCEFPKHVRIKNWKELSPSLDELIISLDYVLGLADRKRKSMSLKATKIPIW
jgi:hypothetical protein